MTITHGWRGVKAAKTLLVLHEFQGIERTIRV